MKGMERMQISLKMQKKPQKKIEESERLKKEEKQKRRLSSSPDLKEDYKRKKNQKEK